MKNPESKKDIFDEIDEDMEQVKKAMKLSRQQQAFKRQIKVLKILIVLVLILSTTLICLSIFKGHMRVNMPLGIISLFLAIYGLVFIRTISKSQTKKGNKS